jgi:2,5-diketo-D-gluconate reductase A
MGGSEYPSLAGSDRPTTYALSKRVIQLIIAAMAALALMFVVHIVGKNVPGSHHANSVMLAGGVQMPMLGYGCCCRPHVTGSAFEHSLRTYLDAGGRLIDTAAGYHNHAEVGRASKSFIADRGLKRDGLFITSKVAYPYGGYESTLAGVDVMLSELGMDHVDLLLLHHPQCTTLKVVPGVPGKPCHDLSKASAAAAGCMSGNALKKCLQRSWDALVDAQKAGKTRAIGVANFDQTQIGWLREDHRPAPAVNQIAYNPLVPASVHSLVRWQNEQSPPIATIAYWSLNGHAGLPSCRVESCSGEGAGASMLGGLASKYNKTRVQVLLRWALDRNVTVIPGSNSPEHIRQNLALNDFHLTEEEGKKLLLREMEEKELFGGKRNKAVGKWGT